MKWLWNCHWFPNAVSLKVHLHIDETWHKNMKQKHYSELAFTHGKQWHKNILMKQIYLCHPIHIIVFFFWEMNTLSSHVPYKMMQDICFMIKLSGNFGSKVYKSEKKGKCFMFLCHFLRILKRRNMCFWHKKCAFLAQKMFHETHVFVPKWHKNICFLYV